MLCVISFIFIFVVIAQTETGDITSGQALFYGLYGLLKKKIKMEEENRNGNKGFITKNNIKSI